MVALNVNVETEDVNLITVKMLPYDFKVVYTFIKKNKTVEFNVLLDKFKHFSVKAICDDLRLMQLVYYTNDLGEVIDNDLRDEG